MCYSPRTYGPRLCPSVISYPVSILSTQIPIDRMALVILFICYGRHCLSVTGNIVYLLWATFLYNPLSCVFPSFLCTSPCHVYVSLSHFTCTPPPFMCTTNRRETDRTYTSKTQKSTQTERKRMHKKTCRRQKKM
jgi:hypothetical protein